MNEDVSFPGAKTQAEITQEWDLIAPARDEQLRSDDDVSFREVLRPFALQSIGAAQSIVDVGCGSGRLTSALKGPGRSVLGIDPSVTSIQIARRHDPSGEYVVDTLEHWVDQHPGETFDVAVVNMVMMDVPDLRNFCRALARIASGGRVIATITHPSFWPIYWSYASNDGFDYMSETTVEAPFKTTARSYSKSTTHFHRPLSDYIREIIDAGISLIGFKELRGAEPTATFPFPRFIAIEGRA